MFNKFSGITLIKAGVDEGKSPELTCSAANEMTLKNSSLSITGNVGSGAWLPGAKLVLNAPFSPWIFLRQERTTIGGGGFYIVNPWANDNHNIPDYAKYDRNRLEIGYKYSREDPNRPNNIPPNQDKINWNQFVLHGHTGNVGIGTPNPQHKLDVNGTIKANQSLHVGPLLIGSTGNGRISATGDQAQLSFAKRDLESWSQTPKAGDRFVWFNQDGSAARLWTDPNQDLLTITKDGKVGIGTKEPKGKLEIPAGSSFGTVTIFQTEPDGTKYDFRYDGGDDNKFYFTNNGNESGATIFNCQVGRSNKELLVIKNNGDVIGRIAPPSSRELKQNIDQLCPQEAVAILADLEPVKFNYKDDNAKNQHIGFIAEDVPNLVATADRKGVPIMDVVGVLTKVLQVQQKTISALENKVRHLEEQIHELL